MASSWLPDDELPAALLNARVRFWMCINREHKSVTWDGDVATCPDCGLTSEMTKRYAARVRESAAQEIEARAGEPGEFWAPAFRQGLLSAAETVRGGPVTANPTTEENK